jgi:adenosylmethionine-8-amino-7-oxononanoate aminotransferase
MEKLAFTNSFSETAIRLASKLVKVTPDDLNAVFFSSGTLNLMTLHTN